MKLPRDLSGRTLATYHCRKWAMYKSIKLAAISSSKPMLLHLIA
jgi:hypothetical protein